MNTDTNRRVNAIRRKRARALATAKKHAFVTHAWLVSIGYFYGELRAGEEPMDAWLRALKYKSFDEFIEDVGEWFSRISDRHRRRVFMVNSQLLQRFNLTRKLPGSDADVFNYETMVKIADGLPKEWRNYINQKVAETTLKSAQFSHRVWSNFKILCEAEEPTEEQRAVELRAKAAERRASDDRTVAELVKRGLISEQYAQEQYLKNSKNYDLAIQRIASRGAIG
jgi:hypothetical protein